MHGGLQEGYQKATWNLHFMKPHTIMTTMKVSFFEVEAVKPNSKYERKQALRRFVKLRQPSRGKISEVVKLPPLGPLNEGMATTYPHKNRYPLFYICSNLFNL